MCGRYLINSEEELFELREIIQDLSFRLTLDGKDSYNGYTQEAFPSTKAPLITFNKELIISKWGFEKWDSKGVIFNARSEGIITSKFFSPYLKSGRCIIPANSYFEWQQLNDKSKIKYRIYDPNKKPLFLAGLMKMNKDGEIEYTIITKEAADNINFIHNRMPLILNSEQVNLWLDKNFDQSLLQIDSINVNYERVG